MGVENRYSVYSVAEMVHIQSEGTTPVPVFSIPDGMIIDLVLAVVKTPNEDAGANNLTVGDNDTADGYIVAADSKAAAGTIYGEDPTARGAYLYDSTKKGSFVKAYPGPKTIYFALSADMAEGEAEGEYLVYIFGHRAVPLP